MLTSFINHYSVVCGQPEHTKFENKLKNPFLILYKCMIFIWMTRM
uniref:Uncharacterized protein n=1 Tax=Rhizophora mucronata TaxID=61149 RepID=A0A2P2N758_RHIMU